MRILAIFLLFLSSFSWAKGYDLTYTRYKACKYYPSKSEYCNSNEEIVWKNGSVHVNLEKNDFITLKLNKKKTYRIKISKTEKTQNNDGEEIVLTTGTFEGNGYVFVLGKDYFNFIKVGHWAMYFSKADSKKKDLMAWDLGTIQYKIRSAGICSYDEESDSYNDSCSYYNYDEIWRMSLRTFKKKGRLMLQVDTLATMTVTDVSEQKNDDGDLVAIYSGLDEGGNECFVAVGKDYLNVADGKKLVGFKESRFSEDAVTKPEKWVVSGSSVAITPNILITNAHVIENLQQLNLYLDGKEIENKGFDVIAEFSDDVLDLAILKVRGAKLNACPISKEEPTLGEDILVYGYPQIELQGDELKVTKGIVSGKNGLKGDKNMFQMDAAVQHGNSGGPIVANGKVIGLATAMLMNSQNVNLGIKSTKILKLLEDYDIVPKPTTEDFSLCTYLLIGE